MKIQNLLVTTVAALAALAANAATRYWNATTLTSGEAEIYNAAGARQNGLQKGVNIIKQGGKSFKVVVK